MHRVKKLKTKATAILILLSYLTIIFTPPKIYAAPGDKCCDAGYTYNQATKRCDSNTIADEKVLCDTENNAEFCTNSFEKDSDFAYQERGECITFSTKERTNKPCCGSDYTYSIQKNKCEKGTTDALCEMDEYCDTSIDGRGNCTTIPNNFSCNWAVINKPGTPADGHIGFCVGGFNSEAEAKNYYFSLRCDYNATACGPITNYTLWKKMTNLPLPTVESDGQGKYFTCFTGPNGDEFDNILKEMGRDAVKNTGIGCTAAGVGVVTAGLVTGGATTIGLAGSVIVKGALTGTACQPAIAILGGMKPNLTGIISGPQSCKSNITFTYDFETDTLIPITPIPGMYTSQIRKLCESVPGKFDDKNSLASKCAECFNDKKGAWTAIGCIKSDPKEFVKQILGFAMGIAGGIAFLMILFGGFQIITSGGDPEKLGAGKEIVGAAITGLLFIIFSMFILQLVGVKILGLPGFG